MLALKKNPLLDLDLKRRARGDNFPVVLFEELDNYATVFRRAGEREMRYLRLDCLTRPSTSRVVISNLQRTSPLPSVEPNSSDANTMKDIIDDGSEGL